MIFDRRRFNGALAAVGASAWFRPVRASEPLPRNDAAFSSRSPESVYSALGLQPGDAHPGMTLVAPDVAENGANVPIEVKIAIPGLQRVLVLGEKNVYPLLMDADWFAPDKPFSMEARIKMGETAKVRVIAVAGDKTYTAAKEIKVTIGGCVSA